MPDKAETGRVTIAIALGISLPELFVFFRSIKDGESELTIGNVFGLNAFSILIYNAMQIKYRGLSMIALYKSFSSHYYMFFSGDSVSSGRGREK